MSEIKPQDFENMLDNVFIQRSTKKEFKIRVIRGFDVILICGNEQKTIYRRSLAAQLNMPNGSWYLKNK